MRRAQLIIFAFVFSCAKPPPPNAVLTVQDPDNVALGAASLGVGPDLDALEKKDLDGHPFPVTLALTTDRRIYEGEVWVEAYASDGTPIGRGFSKADIHEDNPSTVLVTLAKPCDKDENCDDGVFCNGAETCRDRSGLKPAEPGFKTVRIEPHLGSLDRLNAAFPHPRGEITVSYRRLGSDIGASVALPSGLTGELVWRGKTYLLASGPQELKLASN